MMPIGNSTHWIKILFWLILQSGFKRGNLWPEGVAEKVTWEIGSCVYKFVEWLYLQLMKDLIASSDMPYISSSFEADFHQYCSQCASKMPTFKFWNLFVHRDMISYMGLYLAIRSRNFRLRNVCARLLDAPVFHALDRHVYLRIIPHSLTTWISYRYASRILCCGFTVSFCKNSYSSVSLMRPTRWQSTGMLKWPWLPLQMANCHVLLATCHIEPDLLPIWMSRLQMSS